MNIDVEMEENTDRKPENKDEWWTWGQASKKSAHESNEKAAKGPKEPIVTLMQLYSFAENFDYVLMFFGCIGAICHGIAFPLLLVCFGNLLNGIGSATNVQKIVDKNTLYFVWMSILCFGSSWLEIAFWMHTGQRQSAKLREKYLQGLLRQDVEYFDNANTGDVVNSLATDTLAVQDAIGEKSGHFVHHISTFVTSFLVAFSAEWRIALVTTAILPCLALTGGIYAYYLLRYTKQTTSASSEAGTIAQQAISQVRTVYSFVAEEKFVKSYSDALQKTLKFGIKSGLVKGLGLGITTFVIFCCYAVIFTYGGILIRMGKANGGGVFATAINVIVGTTSLVLAMTNFSSFSKAKVSASKIFQVIHHEPFINAPEEGAQSPEKVDGHIELRNVDFSYPARPNVSLFQEFSLIIPAGKSVAIVGSSGSGKSTIVSLIERFYDPIAGEILLDGLNLKKLDLKWLRRQIGLVNQEPALFATTIAANIVYGNDAASQREIEEAATMANAHAFINELPNGYQTHVGERGVQLSGGQRQRIAIARAIVKNPRILLLDEATSALDAGSERVVQEALDRIMVGRTTVIVAHRLSTVRNADTIAVVEQGRIVESGSHQDLLSNENGAYSVLVLLQELATSNEATSKHVRREEINLDPTSFREMLSAESSGRVHSFASEREKQEKFVKASPGSVRRLIGMTKVDWKYAAPAIVGSMGAGCVSPLLAINLANVLSAYYNSPSHHAMERNIAKLSWLFAALGASACGFYTLQHFALGVVGEKLVTRVREKLFSCILRNEVGWFDEADNNSSQLAARLASDAATVRAVIGDRISVLLQTLTMILVSFIISFIIEWRLAFVMATALPLITSANVFEKSILTRFFKDQTKAYDRATEVAGEAVSNIRTVAAFSAEDKVQALFTNELGGLSKQSFRNGHVAGIGYGASQFLLYSSCALGLWYCGHLVVAEVATFQTVIKVYLILVLSGYMAAEAFSLAPDLVKGGQAVASVFQILDRKTKIDPDNPEGKTSERIRGDIQLKKVTLAYPSRPDVIVLRDMDLKVKSGHSLALVGASGSGKSSIIALIERFYDPSSGAILIDGKDIKKYNLQSLRQHIALVQQEPALFATTIYENIAYGKAAATDAEVIEAAKAANAHQFISSLPDAYETLVGDRGVQLSGGQKQRVAIARAVLKDPTIFLLDEATSALDAESEKVVQEAIDRLMMGRTTVMVAHRLSTIRCADSIAVVQDGNIAEQGSHADLVTKGGAYSRLIRLQYHDHKS